jgi:glutaconate CoA-transferase subunit B
MYLEQYGDFWNYAQSGRHLHTFCVGAAQLDRYGNANNSIIGDDYHRPKVRLPGTAGLADMGALGKNLLYWNTSHSPRSLVEKVDFVSCPGYLGGGDERARLGLAGGPQLVVTNLGVLDFEPETRHMRLRSVHPGLTVEEVQAATGFDLVVADDVAETAKPTPEQVRLLREVIDPDGMCKREAGVKPS